ncbi:FkbM family methyltransferase [Pseudomonadales bacterium]|nr:FkbM family methyltransferase [Pseudomonadales bacterium]
MQKKTYEFVKGSNRFGVYAIPRSSMHRPAARKTLRGEVHEAETLSFMINRCGEGDIVHAGTYFGDFLPALSNNIAPEALIWAFEPNPESFFCAKKTIAANKINNVKFSNVGLGARPKIAKLNVRHQNGLALGGGSRFGDYSSSERYESEKVRIVRLDDVVPNGRHVGVMQLDVEGYEKEALTGALATIKRCKPFLILEVLQDSDLVEGAWFAAKIRSLGYQQMQKLHGNIVFGCI